MSEPTRRANQPHGEFWVDVPRDVVRVSGPDALTYLQGQVSQDLLPLAVGDRRWTFLLQPNGRVEVLARVERTAEDAFVFDVDPGYGEALLARLNRFKIRVSVDIEALPWRVLCVRGGEDIVGPDPPPPDGVRKGTAVELEAARVADGWPAMGAEIVPGETIPAETGVVSVAVDFRKGCYAGQELVERMDSRGANAPRSLRILEVAEGASPGDPIEHDGEQVGVLTSVAGTTALGYVKRGVELGSPPAR
jgi:folate-binding protein YgfZ